MMTCKGVLKSLTDYLAGDAGKKVCQAIEDHLSGCKKCRMHVDTMKAIIELSKNWKSDTIPKDVSIRLKRRIQAEVLKK